MTENIDFVDARPRSGYLTHAVPYDLDTFQRTTPYHVFTYRRALCGVGSSGMQVRTNKDTGEIQRYVGVDGCDTCAVKVNKIREGK